MPTKIDEQVSYAESDTKIRKYQEIERNQKVERKNATAEQWQIREKARWRVKSRRSQE